MPRRQLWAAVQTFLPHSDFARSAAVLDDRRLGKQRVEVLQILRALHLEGYGWQSHPAVVMWRGCTAALVGYGIAVVQEWCARGHADTTRANIAEFVHPHAPRTQAELAADGALPPWIASPAVHRSHRSALRRKDDTRYGPLFPDVPDDLPYVWPDPPGAMPARGPRDAWVLRGVVDGATVVVPGSGEESPEALLGRRRTKRVRQILRLAHDVAPGDAVVVPAGGSLRVGAVAGPHRHTGPAHLLDVRWIGELDPSTLRFPAGLQDPQAVYCLHDEPVIRQLLAAR